MSIFEKLKPESVQAIVRNAQPRIRTWFQARSSGASPSILHPIQGLSAAPEGIDANKIRTDVISVLNQLTAEVDHIRSDGTLTFKEVVSFCVRLFQLVVPVVKEFPVDALKQKDYALEIADEFYLRVIAPLDIPYVPSFVENSFVDPLVGRVWHEAASGLYDAMTQFFPTPTA